MKVDGNEVDEQIRVLLVDYDTIAQGVLKAVLEQGGIGEVVGVAPETNDLPRQLRALGPDVVIANVLGNGGAGALEVMGMVRNYSPDTPVIVLTQNENDLNALNAVAAGVSAYVLRKNASAEVLGAVIQSVMKGNATVISVPFMQSFIDSLKNSANQILGRVAGVNGFSIADSVPGTVDPPKPPNGNGYVQAFAETLPAFLSEEGESEFVAFCLEANPIGDMRRAVVAAEGARQHFGVDGVDADGLGCLFDMTGWRKPRDFTQTLRNASRSKYRWLERIPGRSGRYAATPLGISKTLNR